MSGSTPLVILGGIVVLVIVGIGAFYVAELVNAPEGVISPQQYEATDSTPGSS